MHTPKVSPDIKFLERRLEELVRTEQYEKAAIVIRWIRELKNKLKL